MDRAGATSSNAVDDWVCVCLVGGARVKHWDSALENILMSCDLPLQRRQCNLENALWLQRNLAVRNARQKSLALTLLKCEIWRLKQERS